MKRALAFLKIGLLFCIGAVVQASYFTKLIDYKAKSPEEASVLGCLLEFQKCYNNRDLESLDKLISNDAVFLTGKEKAEMNKKQWLETLKNSDDYKFDFRDPKFEIKGKISKVSTVQFIGKHAVKFLFELKKQQDGSWKIFRRAH